MLIQTSLERRWMFFLLPTRNYDALSLETYFSILVTVTVLSGSELLGTATTATGTTSIDGNAGEEGGDDGGGAGGNGGGGNAGGGGGAITLLVMYGLQTSNPFDCSELK